MNILLCPPKIILQHPKTEWLSLQKTAPLVIATCASQQKEITQHLGADITVRFYDNFNDNSLVELDLYRFARDNNVTGVHFLAEIDVLRAARISDRLELTHGRAQSAMLFRDKFLMKSLVQSHQIAIPAMALVNNATEIAIFIEEYGYPCVIKPNDGRGSQGVVVVKNDSELNNYLSQLTPLHYHNLLIEKFIEGEPYQINSLYLRGKPIFVSASRATVSCLDFLSGSTLGLVMEDDNPLHQKLIAYARRLAEEVFPTEENALLHLEVFVNKQNEIIFGELACRLGGCFVNEELGAAFGLDPRMIWLAACLNDNYPEKLLQRTPLKQVGQLNVPPQNATLTAIEQTCPLPFVLKYRATGIVGRHYDPMKLTNGEIISAIVEGKNSNEVDENLNILANWVASHTHWV
ncbi:ATP-grasp domain-containing protein [Xenorhabdus sp. 12]|uniref:ATP-grasp domain-containing protein n=1 Tax=Xenorhabdus santafensis TaxID=2582833 RepID=A0ABU4SES9_9GAMM|nr:ATP-grasp domain-containing protein [Xenorhabdus sp. 12]MDX7989236.1 ATP-grasp domain-containing protein [Xenorhabdus sp. 12]